MSTDSVEQLAAVVVTYNPSVDFVTRLLSMSSQFDRVWIVDNADLRAHDSFGLLAGARIDYISCGTNRGIAAAQNAGVEEAARAGFSWVVLLDQDSDLPAEFGATARKAVALGRADAGIGMFAPAYEDHGIRHGRSDAGYQPISLAIASGALVRLESYLLVGGMDSKLFIDYVDYDFCFKLAARRQRILRLPVTIQHTVGKLTRHRFLFWSVFTSQHEARRLFSAGRNLGIMSARYWHRRPILIALFWAFEIRRLLLIALFETQVWRKVKAFASGVCEAIRHGDRRELAINPLWTDSQGQVGRDV